MGSFKFTNMFALEPWQPWPKKVEMYIIHVQVIVSIPWLTTKSIGAHTGQGQLAQWWMGPSNGRMNSQMSSNKNPVYSVQNPTCIFHHSVLPIFIYLHHKVKIKVLDVLHVYHFISKIFDLFDHFSVFLSFFQSALLVSHVQGAKEKRL